MNSRTGTDSLFEVEDHDSLSTSKISQERLEKLPRLDTDLALLTSLRRFCRLGPGDVWTDPVRGHRVGCLDASDPESYQCLMQNENPVMAVNDPPYNFCIGNEHSKLLSSEKLEEYIQFSRLWIKNLLSHLADHASFYLWTGADIKNGFQPLPDLMLLLRQFPELVPRNFITMRNQRGYGTQKNWMWVRQELLYYVKGNPPFFPEAEYTDIPRILRGYYKDVGGETTETSERSRSEFIRAGNVWVDIQQVFYRLEENVPGCYAQKPLKSIERIIASGTRAGEGVVDLFSHSGTTLIAGEQLGRRVFTCDIEPVFAELTIRRLERLRATGKTGWQWKNPFPEWEIHP